MPVRSSRLYAAMLLFAMAAMILSAQAEMTEADRDGFDCTR